MADINLCYGTFFTVIAAFKKESVNNWQLHHRLMNVEYVPFGDESGHFPLTNAEFNIWYNKKQAANYVGDSGKPNPYERINDFSNCNGTKTLPIQRDSEHRFIGGFLDRGIRPKILSYVQTHIVKFLDEQKSVDIVKAIIELLGSSSVLPTTVFYIDADCSTKTTKSDIIDNRSHFCFPYLIAGVLYYIIKECLDNTVGRAAIEAWKDNLPSGSGIPRVIAVVEPEPLSNDDIITDKRQGSYVDNRNANIGNQKIVNIDTVNGGLTIN